MGLFLKDAIPFHHIARLVAEARETIQVVQNPVLQDILDADLLARQRVLRD